MLIVITLLIIIIVFNNNSSPSDKVIQTLVRQSSRFSTAALQDDNPFIANLHANYGAGYIFALRQIAHDKDILRVTGKDGKRIEEEIVAVQDISAKKLLKSCPGIIPKNKFLAELGGEG